MELAERIRTSAIPPNYEPAVGRDGQPTYRIRPCGSADGRREWFGGSSMPSVTAPIAIESVVDQGSNVVVPGVGTGLEIALLAERLAAHVAIFVYEADVAVMRAWLALRDCSNGLRTGRIVPVCGPDIRQALIDRIRRDPGFEFPHRLVSFFTQRGVEIGRLRAQVEAAATVVIAEQSRRVEEFATALRAVPSDEVDALCALVLSADARPAALDAARAIARSAARAGWTATSVIPERPNACQLSARLSALVSERPNLLILLNGCWAGLTDRLPPDVAAASWFWQPVAASVAAEAARSGRLHFATTPALIGELAAAGLSSGVELLEVGVDTSVFRPGEDARPAQSASVLIVADAIDLRPEAGHVNLESHVALWKEACRLISTRAENYEASMAGDVLDEAQRRCGVELTETELRDAFTNMIRERIGPTAVTRAAIERLVAAGVDVRVLGRGWESHPTVAPYLAEPFPDASASAAEFRRAACVLFAWWGESTAREMLEVLAAGGTPVCRRTREVLSDRHPQLADVIARVPAFARFEEMIRLIRNPLRMSLPLAPVREEVREAHSLMHRLETIRSRLAERRGRSSRPGAPRS